LGRFLAALGPPTHLEHRKNIGLPGISAKLYGLPAGGFRCKNKS
jgi:hypothetical protein